MKHISFRKIHKTLATLGTAFVMAASLLLASCGDIAETDSPKSSADGMANIRIAVADEARTAFPKLKATDFTQFKLACDGSTLDVWSKNSDKDLSAYEVMNAATLSVAKGEHTFVLTATEVNGASYAGTVEANITGDILLTFVLELSSVSSSGNGEMSITFTYPLGDVKKIEATIYNSSDEKTYKDAAIISKYSYTSYDITGKNTYTGYKTFPAGEYIVEFAFLGEEDLPLGTWLEYVYITSGLTSSSSFEIPSFDSIYSIEYDEDSLAGATLTTKPLHYTWQSEITLSKPTKTGYDFKGWFEKVDENGVGIGTAVTGWKGVDRTGNIKLYATWEISKYTVSFDLAGAEGNIDSQTVNYGSTATAPTAPSRTGFNFAGWHTSTDDGVTLSTEPFDFATEIKEPVVLYARWTYTIKLDKNSTSASGEMKDETRSDDDISAFKIPEITFENEGFTFLGWSTNKDALLATYGNGGTVPASVFASGNITLYAIWHNDSDTSSFIVMFESNGGTGIATQLIESGEKVVEPAEESITNEGFKFLGWFTSDDGGTTLSTEPYDFDTAVSSNFTLYAKWIHLGWYISEDGSDTDYTEGSTVYGDGTPAHPFASLSKALTAINSDSGKDSSYDYEVVVSGTIKFSTYVSANTVSGINSLTIRGKTGNEVDKLDGNGSTYILYIYMTSYPLTLKNITVTNCKTTNYDNRAGAIKVTSGKLILEEGALITGNQNTYSGEYDVAGAIGVWQGGTLEIREGAEISGNSAYYGGAVTLGYSNAKLIMNGGKITGNEATATSTSQAYYGGGGVFVYKGVFEMNGGEISNNKARNGGGIAYYSGNLTLNGGVIKGNTATNSGGGISANSLTLDSDKIEICENSATNYGGGIYAINLTINDGLIRANSAGYGGGIYGNYGATINGGKISENVSYQGAGAYAGGNSTSYRINMNGGEISNNIGSGIYTSGYGGVSMKGGIIKENTDYAIYHGGNDSNLSIGGDAYIPAGTDGSNTVYLAGSSKYLTISSDLTCTDEDEPVLTIKPYSYEFGKRVVYSSSVTLTDELLKKIALIQNGTENWYITKDPTSTYYARLTSDFYSIDYKDVGGGDFSGDEGFVETAPKDHYYGQNTELLSPTKEGYVFVGWFKDFFEKNGEYITEGKAVYVLGAKEYSGPITLYAKWAKKSSTVEIGEHEFTIKYSETENFTLTVTEGYKDYSWTVDGEEIAESDTVWTLSDDGLNLSYDNEALLPDIAYVVKLRATDENGVMYEATRNIRKQK